MNKPESTQEFSHRDDVYQFNVFRFPELSDLTLIKVLRNGNEFLINLHGVMMNPNMSLSSSLVETMKSAGKADPVAWMIKDLQNTIVRFC